MRRRHGFTLMEMLIVVAIIGILVAVAIPVFSAQLEKTRAATCMANRRSLQSVLTTSYMADPATLKLGADKSAIDVSDYKDKYVCPSGGVISAKLNENGVAIVSCSKHTGGNLGDSTLMDTLKKDIDASIGGRGKLDSGAKDTEGSGTKALLARLAADGIDLDAMGAKSWLYSEKGQYNILFWSLQDISGMAEKSKVLTMRYNFNTKTYCVSVATIGTDSVDDTSEKYNVLTGENMNDYLKEYPNAKDQTYENALKYYTEHYKDEDKYQQ